MCLLQTCVLVIRNFIWFYRLVISSITKNMITSIFFFASTLSCPFRMLVLWFSAASFFLFSAFSNTYCFLPLFLWYLFVFFIHSPICLSRLLVAFFFSCIWCAMCVKFSKACFHICLQHFSCFFLIVIKFPCNTWELLQPSVTSSVNGISHSFVGRTASWLVQVISFICDNSVANVKNRRL